MSRIVVPGGNGTPAAATHWWLRSGVGTVEYIPNAVTNPYYFLATNKSSSGAGKSFLVQLASTLTTSGGGTWTVRLNANLKLVFTHDAGGSLALSGSSHLAWMLGIDTGATHRPTDTTSVLALAGSGYTAPYRSPLMWCPEERVCFTEPDLFDPMTQSGIKTSAGSMSRAPNGEASYTSNGVQTDAVFGFRAVEGMYRARADYRSDNIHQREDVETWWEHGPRAGRSFLFWRDKDLIINTATPSAGSAQPYNYVEYNPSAELHARTPCQPTVADNLLWWDFRIAGFLGKRLEGIY